LVLFKGEEMDILVLGPGCINCETLEKRVRSAVHELNIKADIFKMSNINTIAQFGVMRTPALVVNDKVLFSGKVPTVEELKVYLSKGVNS